jgi:hypothetical protein
MTAVPVFRRVNKAGDDVHRPGRTVCHRDRPGVPSRATAFLALIN